MARGGSSDRLGLVVGGVADDGGAEDVDRLPQAFHAGHGDVLVLDRDPAVVADRPKPGSRGRSGPNRSAEWRAPASRPGSGGARPDARGGRLWRPASAPGAAGDRSRPRTPWSCTISFAPVRGDVAACDLLARSRGQFRKLGLRAGQGRLRARLVLDLVEDEPSDVILLGRSTSGNGTATGSQGSKRGIAKRVGLRCPTPRSRRRDRPAARSPARPSA
jgi:hypothetical protein